MVRGLEPGSRRSVPGARSACSPHFSGRREQQKQDSTCKAKFSTTQRKRRPLKFKQPRRSGRGDKSAGQIPLLCPPLHSAASPFLPVPAVPAVPAVPEVPGSRPPCSARCPGSDRTYLPGALGVLARGLRSPGSVSCQPRTASCPAPGSASASPSNWALRHPGNTRTPLRLPPAQSTAMCISVCMCECWGRGHCPGEQKGGNFTSRVQGGELMCWRPH